MRISYFFIVVGCFFLSACGKKKSETKKTEPVAAPVSIAIVTNAIWDKTLSVIGTLYAMDDATVAAQVDGTVEETFVDFGDRVEANQDLASIDKSAYEAQLEQVVGNLARAEATLVNARQNFERIRKLQKSGAVSLSELDASKAQLDQAEAEVKAGRGSETVARLNVERSHVKAPFNGAVAQRFVERGDFVKVGTSLFKVVNDTTLKFIFQVPERYASLIKKDLVIHFMVDNYPGETFSGQVYLINPAVVTASRAFEVAASVPNMELRLKANTFARGIVVLEREVPTPVVPLEAVVNFAGVTKVFIVEGNKARSRQVNVGRVRDGLQEVEGIKPGEKVIVTGQNNLSDNALVKVQNFFTDSTASEEGQ